MSNIKYKIKEDKLKHDINLMGIDISCEYIMDVSVIRLNNEFVDSMRLRSLRDPLNHRERAISKKAKCPYCDKGYLELTKFKKNICETHVCHTGNTYHFKCSEMCNGVLYTYTNRWMYC